MGVLGAIISTSKKFLGNYSVTWSVNTESKDGATGQKTNSYATATSLSCAFFKHSDEQAREVVGDYETGDASLMVVYDHTIARNDKVIVTYSDSGTETYLVEHVEPPVGKNLKVAELSFSE